MSFPSDLHVIVGLGATGFSCAQFLTQQGLPFAIVDTREQPPNLNAFKKQFPDAMVCLGKMDESLLQQAARIILSPGISLQEPIIAEQIKKNKSVIGDIELFAQYVHAPVIGITGTNAKSTVTTLVGKMAEASHLRVHVGGNLGVPALTLLQEQKKLHQHTHSDLFVLELSSFQLETTHTLQAKVASILNITPDHMDRYHSLADYQQAKYRIYKHCDFAICNRDDQLTECHEKKSTQKFHFTLSSPKKNEFGIIVKNNEKYLAFEDELLLSINELPIVGKHYHANALSALAIGYAYGFSFEAMLNVLREFQGLPHRCQFIRELNHVNWFNDSKGTNVGATQAAIEGLGSEIKGKIILIAGGVGKNADFSQLIPVLKKYVRHAILIGEAAQEIANAIDHIPHSFAKDIRDAIYAAQHHAQKNDSVLLSPACASFDMFKNFEHRGEVFMELVKKL